MARLSIRLLGGFEVELEGAPVTQFATDKARALLAYLAVEADRAHPREALAGLLWPDQPEPRARQSLRQALSHLRQALKEDAGVQQPLLLVEHESIHINPQGGYWLDVGEFTALARQRRHHRHRAPGACLPCLQRAERMAALYRGHFLAHFSLRDSAAFEEWATLQGEWLQRELLGALADLSDFSERRGDLRAAQEWTQRQVALDPWCEEAHQQLMRLLARAGQRSAALAQYERCRRALAEELGIEPSGKMQALRQAILAGEEPPEGPARPVLCMPLPLAPTPFVGREAERGQLAEHLADPDCRLVTLVGAGGLGKTRLALQVADEQRGAFADGVCFVGLAAVDSAEGLVSAVAAALGLRLAEAEPPPLEQVLRHLRGRELLLVLDSLEQVTGASGVLAALLARAPGVVLLATSRERLNLREEVVFALEGLPYPPDDATVGAQWEAVALFQACAQRAERRFTLTPEEWPAVSRMCRRVEGVPLAIELAAAWVGVHSCTEIAVQIEQSLDLLTSRMHNAPERQRSMRATFEYSWQWLTETEATLLARLSVFRGGFTPAAAASVADADPRALTALVSRFLVRPAGPARYELHELLRQFAAEKLEADPVLARQTAARHRRTYGAWLEEQARRLTGAAEQEALEAIGRELANLRQAWQSALAEADARFIGQCVDGLYRFLSARCRFGEGVELLAQALARWEGEPRQEALIGRLLARQGTLLYHLGAYAPSRQALERGLALAEGASDPREMVFCLVQLANLGRAQGTTEETEALAARALALARQTDDAWGIVRALFVLSAMRQRVGDLDVAGAMLAEGLAVARATGNLRLVMTVLNALADLLCHRGDYTGARSAYEECLTLSRGLEDPLHISIHLNNLGTLLHMLRQHGEARRLYLESLALCQRIGDASGEAIALSNLGELAHAQGAYEEARAYYAQGLAISRTIGEPGSTAICLYNLGETAALVGDLAGGRKHLAEALALCAQTGDTALLLKVLINVAALYVREGRRAPAAELAAAVAGHSASEQDIRERANALAGELAAAPVAPRPLGALVEATLADLRQDT